MYEKKNEKKKRKGKKERNIIMYKSAKFIRKMIRLRGSPFTMVISELLGVGQNAHNSSLLYFLLKATSDYSAMCFRLIRRHVYDIKRSFSVYP